ncbi:hypothetical protein [Streptomyces sp. NPDC059909]|uniref:hypothetical protein n=1 Tax=Streptomyces sp. NPDC059909 TaxID=3346998 RepID=UPI00364B4917
MSAAARVGRFYTSSRRHPWVLGKVADWRIPLGPYTPAQIALAVGGGFVLIKTISLWSWMGPVPVAAWVLAIWAVRRPRIAGRAPLPAAIGWLLLAGQPRGGRIGGRAARDRAARPLLGGFVIEDPAAAGMGAIPAEAASAKRRTASVGGRAPGSGAALRSPRRRPASDSVTRLQVVVPVSGVQGLLELSGQGGGVR